MTRFKLLLRSLSYFRLANFAVAAGMAIATAVLTGAIMVGDSVRGSLRELAVQRLGPVDYALVSTRFFPEDLAKRLAASPKFTAHFDQCVAGISLRGGATDENGKVRASGAQILALADWITPAADSAIMNTQAADALLMQRPGATAILKLPIISDLPRDAAMAKRGAGDVTSGLRTKVTQIVSGRDMPAMFNLAGGQRPPMNVWTRLRDLQDAVEQPRRVNMLLVHGKGTVDQLNAALADVLELGDYGLSTRKSADGSEVVLNSASTYIPPGAVAADTLADCETGIRTRRVSVYLINNVVRLGEGGAADTVTHYALAAGVSRLPGVRLADDEIALNEWAARQLSAKVGSRIRLDYFKRQANGDMAEVKGDREFKVAAILPMKGLGADRTLTPDYKGLTEADRFRDWQPPVGLDIKKELADEDYWKQYKAAPKVFLNLEAAERMWGSPFGDINSIRVPSNRSDEYLATFLRDVREHVGIQTMGFTFTPIRAQQLAAASGSTDFSGLFIGFSFFLIAAAALLVAMLFRLGVEQRARQFGVLGAIGFTPRSLRRMALVEGLLLAIVGGLAGVGLAIGYTWLMILGLRTWWVGAVGTTALALHVQVPTLIIGFTSSIIIAVLVIVWSVWRIARTPAATLLAGGWGRSTAGGTGRSTTLVGAIALALGLATVLLSAAKLMPADAGFMGGGFLLLVGALCLVGGQLRHVRRDADLTRWSVPALAFRNAGRNRARSVSTVGLIAFATFVLVTVSAMKQGEPIDTHRKDSGTGGYQLIVQTDLPLMGDLGTRNGRAMIGINPTQRDLSIWDRARFMPLRLWAGQDISCLNITRPTSPTILGVSDAFIQRHAFTSARQNPWELLRGGPEDVVPVIADQETAAYILKLGIGDTLDITDQVGRPRKLRLVATIAHSIFQSELLMGEANFIRLFPSQSGFGMTLVEAPGAEVGELRTLLAENLAEFSPTIERTADRLMRFQEVANTYLSTFQTLGSLGLLLGTIGLGVVLLRSLVERRSELALLSAIGFARAQRLKLVLTENAFLLVLGLLIGAATALVGVVPATAASSRHLNWAQLTGTLAAVLFTGLLTLFLAVYFGARRIAPADLRAE